MDGKLPALRAIEVTPAQTPSGERFLALIDPQRIAARPLALSPASYIVLIHLDGEHTLEDVQAEFRKHFGEEIPREDVEGLVAALDRGLFLRNERFEAAYGERVAAYLASPVRDNRDRWPAAAEVRAEIKAMLATGTAALEMNGVCGVLAPHLDYARGGPCYADAYAIIAAAGPADRYIILGTNHFGRSGCVVACSKDFQTPFGVVRTDRAFIERIEKRIKASIRENEYDHALEHSVELQVHVLQAIAGDRPFEVVGVLCPDPSGPTGTAPYDGNGPDLRVFADALASEVSSDDRRTILIAGADLSHVGRRFGDAEPTTAAFLEAVGQNDRRLLALLERREEEMFVADIYVAKNHTRICSVGCVYTLLRALPGRRFRVVRYHQAANVEMETTVTCAAGAVW